MTESTVKGIRYTADLITDDGSDTGVYGDGCEPGHGQTMESGWYQPNWSTWEVYPDCPTELTDVYTDERDDFPDEPSPAQWLADQLDKRLEGVTDFSDFRENAGGAIYSADSYRHPYEGKEILPAAHPEGFTSEEYAEAFQILKSAGRIY